MTRMMTIASVAIAVAAQVASAATVYLQDIDSSPLDYKFNGVSVTNTPFDDGQLQTDAGASANNSNFGSNASVPLRLATNGVRSRGLLAVKNLFAVLPPEDSGQTLEITSAKLHLAGGGTSSTGANYYPSFDPRISINRVKTDWLELGAGLNETRFSGYRRNANILSGTTIDNSTGQAWAGAGAGLNAADQYTENAVVNAAFGPTNYGVYVAFDITGMLQDMYEAEENFGFIISSPTSTIFNFRSSNDTLAIDALGNPVTFRPVLEINYSYVPEPGSLMACAAVGMLVMRRRR